MFSAHRRSHIVPFRIDRCIISLGNRGAPASAGSHLHSLHRTPGWCASGASADMAPRELTGAQHHCLVSAAVGWRAVEDLGVFRAFGNQEPGQAAL